MQQDGKPAPTEQQQDQAQATPASDKEALSNPELFEAYEESLGDLSDADNAASAAGPAV